MGVNASGQVVGVSLNDAGEYEPYLTGPNGAGMTGLGTIPGCTGGWATGLNDLGQVAGYGTGTCTVPNGATAFVTDANGQNLHALGIPNADARSINNAGQVAGTTVELIPDPNSPGSSFANVLPYITGPNGVGTTIVRPPGGQPGVPGQGPFDTMAMNASGQLTGLGGLAGSGGFITGPNGVGMSFIDPLGGFAANPLGINGAGRVVGYSDDNVAFITGANGVGTSRLVAGPSGDNTIAEGINDAGLVVGMAFDTNAPFSHAFLFSNATGLTLLDAQNVSGLGGWQLTEAFTINDSGYIAANAVDPTTGIEAGFLLAPVIATATPEPATWALLGGGLLLVGMVARRRRDA